MITDAILQFVYYFVWFLSIPLRAMDSVTLPQGIIDAIQAGQTALAPFNAFVPLNQMMLVLGVAISYEVGYITYKLVMWGIRRLPTQS